MNAIDTLRGIVDDWINDEGKDALAAVESLAEAAERTVAGAKRDLPEWLVDDGEYTVDGFDYFIKLDAALRAVKGTE